MPLTRIASRSDLSQHLGERLRKIGNPRFAIFRAEREPRAVRPPRQRRYPRRRRFFREYLRTILDAAKHNHSVLEADRNDLLLRVAGDRHRALAVGREHARLLAHRPVLRLEWPENEL